MESFEELLEDLGGKVKILSHAPVFNGTYSRIYRGQIRHSGELVRLFKALLIRLSTEQLSGRHQGPQRSRRRSSPHHAKSESPVHISNILYC